MTNTNDNTNEREPVGLGEFTALPTRSTPFTNPVVAGPSQPIDVEQLMKESN